MRIILALTEVLTHNAPVQRPVPMQAEQWNGLEPSGALERTVIQVRSSISKDAFNRINCAFRNFVSQTNAFRNATEQPPHCPSIVSFPTIKPLAFVGLATAKKHKSS